MSTYIKNADSVSHKWGGQYVDAGQYYMIQDGEVSRFSNSSQLLLDIASSLAIVARDNSGNTDISDFSEAINQLKGIDKSVKIEEESENAETGGTFQASGFEFNIQAGAGVQKFTVSFPHGISLFSAEWICKAGMDNDVIDFIITPDTIIGAIIAPVSIGENSISVSPTVLANTKVGRELTLWDGINTENLGRVIDIDQALSIVTMEKTTTKAFSPLSPTYVKQNIFMARDVYLEDQGRFEVGKDIIGGSYIPANYPLELRYNNVSTLAKKFRAVLELKY